MESANRTGPVHYRTTAAVGGVNVFYREAGPNSAPIVLLLHGFPSSSRMFRDLIPRLSDAYHVIAPDYPAFGHSAVPDRSAFGYTFDHLADMIDGLLDQLGIDKFAIYVMDFGAAVGFRLALRHPERLSAIIVQNAPLYPWEPQGWWATLGQYWADGSAAHRHAARSYLDLEGLRGQYLSGVEDPSRIDPDNWVIDKALIDRPDVDEIMLDLLYDIRNQVPVFKAIQEFLHDRRPPTLVATGANDEIFPEVTVRQILTDHPDAEYHALQTGHFALEDKAVEIAALMRDFLARTVPRAPDHGRPPPTQTRTATERRRVGEYGGLTRRSPRRRLEMTTTNVDERVSPLPSGTAAPDFELRSAPDQTVSLAEFRGRPVILVFYPGDWSPVCSDQLALYQAVLPEFQRFNAQLLGISVDGVWSHQAFARDRNLHFPLLADFEPKGEVARAYRVYRADDGTSERALYVIDADGIVRWSYVSPVGVNPGVDGILRALENLARVGAA